MAKKNEMEEINDEQFKKKWKGKNCSSISSLFRSLVSHKLTAKKRKLWALASPIYWWPRAEDQTITRCDQAEADRVIVFLLVMAIRSGRSVLIHFLIIFSLVITHIFFLLLAVNLHQEDANNYKKKNDDGREDYKEKIVRRIMNVLTTW